MKTSIQKQEPQVQSNEEFNSVGTAIVLVLMLTFLLSSIYVMINCLP